MKTARVELPPKLIPVFAGEADVRGAYGGRGSGKTRSFAKMTAVRAYMWAAGGRSGQILCGRQFMKTLADSSLEEIKQAIREEPWLAEHFDIGETYIRTMGLPGAVYYTFLGLDRNIDSVKSQARILLAWVDEAEPVTDEAWTKLIPTLREEDSELWVTWNPERKKSATHKRFRAANDNRYKVVELNFRDNPRFPAILERQRQRDMKQRPEQYGHIWEGDFVTAVEGAYYAASLNQAKLEGRIGRVPADPLMTLRAFVDIGGTGARADNFVIWIAQFIGKEIRVIDHYEVQGQPASAHVAWLRERGYSPAKCQIWLPHDGETHDRVHDASYEGYFRQAGYTVTVIPNQGKGAAKMRVEAGRRLFPAIWFNAETTEGGRDAIGWYHEKKDDDRDIGLGPEHDWSSHSADAFGLMCVAYEEPKAKGRETAFVPRKVV
jgi:phage terminase large subunit